MRKLRRYTLHLLSLIKYLICLAYCLIFRVENNDTWLISERGDDARDNGYHFYRYLKENGYSKDVRYVIEPHSADREKLLAYGEENIVRHGSFEHYVYFLTSAMLISTHQMGYSPDAVLFQCLDRHKLLKIRGKKVFLQHGIIKDRLEFESSFDLFISGAEPEYEFLKENYPDMKNIIRYTGHARFDALRDTSEENQILYMPTFRRWLVNSDRKMFTESEYYKKNMSFLNSPQLLEILEKTDSSLIFYPHHEIQKYIDLFSGGSDRVRIADFKNYDVQDLLKSSRLLITDYSSVFFDFAYMNKPVICYQYDEEKFREGHYKKGYFDFYTDGFGAVVKEEDELLRELLKQTGRGFRIEDKYLERIPKHFSYRDSSNCRRILTEIEKLQYL